MALFNAKRFTIVLTLVEAARRFARENPGQAAGFVDKAAGFVDTRTQGRFASPIASLSGALKRLTIGHDPTANVAGQVTPTAPEPEDRPAAPFTQP